jgi:CRISPR/Cas system endoribonuclease Cas6 (RAMP superfamily)
MIKLRIKVSGKIIEKSKPNKRNYSHETQSMILNKLSPKTASELHEKKKFFRFLTFTNICINNNSNTAHFYIAGKDELVSEFIQNMIFDNIIKIDDMVIVAKIEQMTELPIKEKYRFKTKLVVNLYDNELHKPKLCEDMSILKERLIKNTLDKCKQLGIEGNLDINIINPFKVVDKYKAGHIFSWKCNLEIIGDYDVVNTIYNVGIGENTFTGNGFLWEC